MYLKRIGSRALYEWVYALCDTSADLIKDEAGMLRDRWTYSYLGHSCVEAVERDNGFYRAPSRVTVDCKLCHSPEESRAVQNLCRDRSLISRWQCPKTCTIDTLRMRPVATRGRETWWLWGSALGVRFNKVVAAQRKGSFHDGSDLAPIASISRAQSSSRGATRRASTSSLVFNAHHYDGVGIPHRLLLLTHF